MGGRDIRPCVVLINVVGQEDMIEKLAFSVWNPCYYNGRLVGQRTHTPIP